ncbi:MAG TPA: serine hydrolase, partial [Chloroflexota bacterium]|nr:serine hydrolase [Chloroflexota bacterium]
RLLVLGPALLGTTWLAPGAGAATPEGGAAAPGVPAAVASLDALVAQAQRQTGVPGISVAVVFRDEVVYLKGFGVRAVGRPEAVDPDTVFQIASVSKPIASTIVSGVIGDGGDGGVAWDDPVIEHDPGFRLADASATRAVTLRDLFSHRSGLPEYAGDLLEDIGYDREAILSRLRFLPLGNRFRATYNYTNFGLTEAAVAVARTTGMSWEDLAAARLYRPLGMTHTSSRFSDFIAEPNRASGHVELPGGRWESRYQRTPQEQSPAGGVSSSARDLAQWVRLQLANGAYGGRQLVDAAALAETHRPQMVSNQPRNPFADRAGFYGLGWNVSYDAFGKIRLGHSGAFALGAATAVYLLPAEQVGIVVLTNGAPIGVPESIALAFLDTVQTGAPQQDYIPLLGRAFRQLGAPTYGTEVDYSRPPAGAAPPLPAAAYAGDYANDYFGPLRIEATAAGLVLRLGPHLDPFPLTPFARDTFTYQPVGEQSFGPAAVTFTIGADGTGASVLVENLDLYDNGTFVREPPAGTPRA